MNLKSSKELAQMVPEERLKYYEELNQQIQELDLNTGSKKISKKIIAKIAPMLRNYKLEIYGDENLPKDDSAVFICNHSNSHDFFTTIETFDQIGKNVTPFGADDCLDFVSLQLFKAGDVTIVDRTSKESTNEGIMTFSKKIVDGENGIIFGEGTWNLHPTEPMLKVRPGGSQAALISKKVMIPTIFEYVEVPEMVDHEKDLYTRCIVEFGKPVVITPEDNIYEKTMEVQQRMTEMRRELWKKLGIKKDSIEDINKDIYLNHTYLKKFDATGFEYDSDHEFQFLSKNADGVVDNEYIVDENGDFVPGITHRR